MRRFDLLTGVLDFRVRYHWIRPLMEGAPAPSLLSRRGTIVERENPRGWGVPQAVEVTLRVVDTTAEKGYTTFQNFVTFGGATSYIKRERWEAGLGGGGAL